MEVSNHRTKLPHNVIIKAPGLLPMLYTLREIWEELDIAESTLRDWLQLDVPHLTQGQVVVFSLQSQISIEKQFAKRESSDQDWS